MDNRQPDQAANALSAALRVLVEELARTHSAPFAEAFILEHSGAVAALLLNELCREAPDVEST